MAAAEDCPRRGAAAGGGTYYGSGGQLEETIRRFRSMEDLNAIVTRNHYGCLVLNTPRALFIDVDMPEPLYSNGGKGDDAKASKHRWRQKFGDLCTVLANEQRVGFRVYRTAAGFRILATTHEFEPTSWPSQRLMRAVGADACFVKLCRTQRTFRARLTPKPWRCGMLQPPNLFPRLSNDERNTFDKWLAQYEQAGRDRATCQFLADVGPSNPHPRIEPLIQFHDGATRAFKSLPLA